MTFLLNFLPNEFPFPAKVEQLIFARDGGSVNI